MSDGSDDDVTARLAALERLPVRDQWAEIVERARIDVNVVELAPHRAVAHQPNASRQFVFRHRRRLRVETRVFPELHHARGHDETPARVGTLAVWRVGVGDVNTVLVIEHQFIGIGKGVPLELEAGHTLFGRRSHACGAN